MTLVELAIQYAFQWVGKPYIWGGDDYTGFDCSGFAQEILASVGLDFPGDQTAKALFEKMADFPEKMEPGSLAFFGSIEGIRHVGFMVSETIMIEAGGGGSKTTSPEMAAKHNAYIRMRPVFNRRDFVAAKYPFPV